MLQKNVTQESLSMGDEPQKLKCEYCKIVTITQLDYQNGYNTYILAFMTLLLFGIIPSMVFIPMVFLVTKNTVHRCSACLSEIGTNGKIFLGFNLRDKVVAFKIGEMGFILTRKIIIGFFLTVIAALILFVQIKNAQNSPFFTRSYDQDNIVFTNQTWDQYREKCARNIIMTDEKQFMDCAERHMGQTVKEWKGYVIRIQDYRESLYRYLHHAVSILVQFDPPEDEQVPDAMLTFDSFFAEKYSDQIDQLDTGVEVAFNATLKGIGNEMHIRHFHAIGIEQREGFKEVPLHIHNNGRYMDNQNSAFMSKDGHNHD